MMTSAECIVQAQRQDALARQTPSEMCRAVYFDNADSWRRLATMALWQEAWARGD